MKITHTKITASTPTAKWWMAKYYPMDGGKKLVYFEGPSSITRAEKDFESWIPEPYKKAVFLGSLPVSSEKALRDEGFEKVNIYSSTSQEVGKKLPRTFSEWLEYTHDVSRNDLDPSKFDEYLHEYREFLKDKRRMRNTGVYSAEDSKLSNSRKDRKRSPTNVRYKGYFIVLDRGGDGYNVYNEEHELEEEGIDSLKKAKEFVDTLRTKSHIRGAEVSDDIGFNEWLYQKYGIYNDDLTNDDYDMYEDMYRRDVGRTAIHASEREADDLDNPVEQLIRDLEADGIDIYNYEEVLQALGADYGLDRDEQAEALEAIQEFLGFEYGCVDSENKYWASLQSAEEINYEEDDLEQVDQEFTSKDTSINKAKLPAIYNLVNFPKGSLVIDYGGGKFDNGSEYLESLGSIGLVYDPYNRTSEHNREVVRKCRENGGADIGLCSNVLNVIKEPEVRKQVLINMSKLVKPRGAIYITVYEGSGSGEGKQSQSDSYQLNRKTKDYLEEIQEVFPDATRKGKLIKATNTGAVTSNEAIMCNTDGLEEVKDMFEDGYQGSGWMEEEIKLDQGDGLRIKKYLEDLGYKVKKSLKDNIWILPDECFWSDTVFYPYRPDTKINLVTAARKLGNRTSPYQIREDMKELQDDLYNAAAELLTSEEFSFPLNEIADYLVVEVTPIYEIPDDKNSKVQGYKAEVRAELEYSGMDELAQALNPVVEIRDSNAYFDHVTSGIIDAYMYFPTKYSPDDDIYSNRSITSAVSTSDVHSTMMRAVNITNRAQLNDVLSDLLSIDKKLYLHFCDLDQSGEYSPAALGKMISNELYWKLDKGSYEDADDIVSSTDVDTSDVVPANTDENMMMFYVGPGYPSRKQIEKYAKEHGHNYIFWGSDESYGMKGMYNGDTLVTYADINLLEDGYREDAEKYGEPIESSQKIGGVSNEEIYDYLEELGGYVDYDGKIEALMEDFDLDRETAESFVWDWASGLHALDSEDDEYEEDEVPDIDSILDDVVENFKNITGEDIQFVYNTNPDGPIFNDDTVNKTSEKIIQYFLDRGIESYKVDDLLYDLDEKLESYLASHPEIVESSQNAEWVDYTKYPPGSKAFDPWAERDNNKFPGYAVEWVTGYAGNGVNHTDVKYFRTSEERDAYADQLRARNAYGVRTYDVPGFYHTPQDVTASQGSPSYKLRFYIRDGANKGNLDHEEFFDTKEDALKAYRKVFDRNLYSLNPTVWVAEDGDWRRLMGDELVNASETVESATKVEDDGWTREYNSELEREEYYLHTDSGKAFIRSFDYDGRWGYHAVVEPEKGRKYSKSFELKGSLEKAKKYCEDHLYKKDVNSSQSIEAGKLIDAPQEVVDELLEILGRYGFVLDSRFSDNPGRTLIMGNIHLQVINPDSFVDTSDPDNISELLREYVSRDMINEIHALEKRSNCPITWNFGVDEDGHVTGGLDIDKQWIPDDVESSQNIQSASYGGAYDIEDDQYFTKEDLVEVGDKIAEDFGNWCNELWYLDSTFYGDGSPNLYEVHITDGDTWLDASVKVDMRRIRLPKDLIKYEDELLRQLKDSYREYYTEDLEDVTSATEIVNWDDPIETKKVYQVEFDCQVVVEEDGSYYIPEEFTFGPIYDDEFGFTVEEDSSIIAEHIQDLVEYQIPDEPGTYRISGIADIAFELSNIYEVITSPEGDDVTPGQHYDTEDVRVRFDYASSIIENFQFEKV